MWPGILYLLQNLSFVLTCNSCWTCYAGLFWHERLLKLRRFLLPWIRRFVLTWKVAEITPVCFDVNTPVCFDVKGCSNYAGLSFRAAGLFWRASWNFDLYGCLNYAGLFWEDFVANTCSLCMCVYFFGGGEGILQLLKFYQKVWLLKFICLFLDFGGKRLVIF